MHWSSKNRMFCAGALAALGGAFVWTLLPVAGSSAHAQPAHGNGTGGVPEVLAQLAAMKQQIDAVESGLHARINNLEAELDARLSEIDGELEVIVDLNTPADFDMMVNICFAATGGVGMALGAELGGGLSLAGNAGIDFFGNGMTLDRSIDGALAFGLEAPASFDVAVTFCIDVPVPRVDDLHTEEAALASALRSAAEDTRAGIVEFLEAVGMAADTIEMKVADARNIVKNFPEGADVAFLLFDPGNPLGGLVDRLPLNNEIKGWLDGASAMVPTTPQQINPCHGDFFLPTPDVVDPLQANFCNNVATGAQTLEDAIRETEEVVNGIKSTVDEVKSAVDFLEGVVCSIPGVSCD